MTSGKNIGDATFISDGATTKRSFAARFGDQVNVKDFGATGNGSSNDAPAIQAAFDAAFGTAASPHAIATSNRKVVFPFGRYVTNSTLTLTQVYGGHIWAPHNTKLLYSGSGIALDINGMQNTRIDGLNIVAPSGSVGLNLDWDGSGTVGLSKNTLYGLGITGAPAIGIHIASSANQGDATTLVNCIADGCATAGIKISATITPSATLLINSRGINCGVGVQLVGGSVISLEEIDFSGNTSWDFKADSASSRVNLSGIYSTSTNFTSLAGDGALANCRHTGVGTFVAMASPSKVLFDLCTSAGNVTGTGSLYKRAYSFGTTGFSGTTVENIP